MTTWPTCGVRLAMLLMSTGIVSQPAPVAAQGANQSFNRTIVSEAAMARLRLAGLDPTARDFAHQVQLRLGTPFAMRTGATITAQPRTVRTQSVKVIVASQLSQSLQKGVAQAKAGSQTVARHVPYFAGALEWQVLLQPPDLSSVTSIQQTATYQGFLAGLLAPGPVDVSYAIPACGVTVHVAGNSVDTGRSDLPAVVFPSNDHPVVVPIGARPQPGSVTIRGGERSSDGLPVTFFPVNATIMLPLLDVDYAPPFLSNNTLGFASENTSFAQATTERLNLSLGEMSGDDYLGQRVQLGAGYTMSASIVASRSVADLGDSSPDNSYRGAMIRTQPSSNRLETVVHWHVSPGDSLQYQVRWTATGPVGQRPISSMPKTGLCDS